MSARSFRNFAAGGETGRVCDKYLLRFDPPSVVIFSGASYAEFAAQTLERYLDADIRFIGSRNRADFPISLRPGNRAE